MNDNWQCFWWAVSQSDIRDCLIYLSLPWEITWKFDEELGSIPYLQFHWPQLKVALPYYLQARWDSEKNGYSLEDIPF